MKQEVKKFFIATLNTNKYIFLLDLKQELLVKEKEKGPDNERVLNGYKSSTVDSNRLKENETQTTPVKRKLNKITKAFKAFSALCKRVKKR